MQQKRNEQIGHGAQGIASTSTMKDFEILSKLGQGSFGIVYKVRRRTDKQIYVLKQIELANLDARAKHDAINEAKILSTVECPYVVKYFDSFVEKTTLNIVLEFCEGGDLYKLLKGQMGKMLTESKIWRYFIQVTLGLHYLHSKKILHRDLKSLNIFLTKEGDIRIGDLGGAKVLQDTGNFAQTLIGTPYYLSPEMCQEKPYNEKSDVWSLGCILYELCTLRHPFEATNQAALIFKIIKGKFAPVSNQTYSQELCHMVDWLLTHDYRKRPNTRHILEKAAFATKAQQLGLLPMAHARSEPVIPPSLPTAIISPKSLQGNTENPALKLQELRKHQKNEEAEDLIRVHIDRLKSDFFSQDEPGGVLQAPQIRILDGKKATPIPLPKTPVNAAPPILPKKKVAFAQEAEDRSAGVKRIRKGAPTTLARNAKEVAGYSQQFKQKLVKQGDRVIPGKITRPKTGEGERRTGEGFGHTREAMREARSREEEINDVLNLPEIRHGVVDDSLEDEDLAQEYDNEVDPDDMEDQLDERTDSKFITEDPSDYLKQQIVHIEDSHIAEPQPTGNNEIGQSQGELNVGWQIKSSQSVGSNEGMYMPRSHQLTYGPRSSSKLTLPTKPTEEQKATEEAREPLHDSLERSDGAFSDSREEDSESLQVIKHEFLKTKEDTLKDLAAKVAGIEKEIHIRTSQVLGVVSRVSWDKIMNFCRSKIDSDEELTGDDQEELDFLIRKYVPNGSSSTIENIFFVIAKENEASRYRQEINNLRFELIH